MKSHTASLQYLPLPLQSEVQISYRPATIPLSREVIYQFADGQQQSIDCFLFHLLFLKEQRRKYLVFQINNCFSTRKVSSSTFGRHLTILRCFQNIINAKVCLFIRNYLMLKNQYPVLFGIRPCRSRAKKFSLLHSETVEHR